MISTSVLPDSGAISNPLITARLQSEIAKAQRIQAQLVALRARRDPWYWLTECTKTQDEQDPLNPFKPFPKKKYLFELLQALQNEPEIWLEKSRTMLCSWLVSGFVGHLGFNNPATGVVFQSEDEARAVHDVEYVKILWTNSSPELKEAWPLAKPLEKQPYNELHMANKSWFMGIPGNPDKIRSEHPTVVVLDEAAHIERGEQSYNISVATQCLRIIALSSANPGWFRDATEFAELVDWPDYGNVEGS